MYWSISGPHARIVRSLLDGSNQTTIVNSGISSPAALSVDISTGDVYWTDVNVDAIQVRCSVCVLTLLFLAKNRGIFSRNSRYHGQHKFLW